MNIKVPPINILLSFTSSEMYNVIGKLESDVTLLKGNIGEYVSVVKTGATTIEVENREILKGFTSDQVNDAINVYYIVLSICCVCVILG